MGVAAVRAALGRGGRRAGAASRPRSAGPPTSGVAAGHKVLGELALTGIPIVDIEAGCASGAAALQLAAGAIRAGQHDCVLVFGIEKMPKGIIRSSFFEPWREEAGLAATPAYFALRAQRLLRESGLTKDDLARVVVKNRRHGVHNPNAMFRKEVTAEEVLGSRLVCDPLHLFMLCSPNEGAAAVVLRRANGGGDGRVLLVVGRAALAPAGQRARRSHADGRASTTPTSRRRAPSRHRTRTRRPASAPTTSTWSSARTPTRPASCSRGRSSGCARPASSAQVLDAGDAALGGRRPVNPSGGLLSKGEPLGASGLGQVVELVEQLRGNAGARQVEGARVGLAHTVGRGANASVTILQRT